jgi:hypothetical protein
MPEGADIGRLKRVNRLRTHLRQFASNRAANANGSPGSVPDDKLRDTHQLHFAEVMGFAGLNPSGLATRPAQVIFPSGGLLTGVSIPSLQQLSSKRMDQRVI